ncbi:MAG: TolC family protein [Ignavibacteriales bacterium]|nr:TolC family protein [Ignavibacteriales bacterium]
MFNKIFFFILIFTVSTTGNAQDKVKLTVEQAIASGLENSKSLHSSLMKVEYADAKSSEVTGMLFPTLKFGGSYTRLSEVPPFEIGPFGPIMPQKITVSPAVLDNYSMRLTLQQPIFTGLKLFNSSKLAGYSADAASEDYEKDKVDLIYNIQNSYWNVFKAIESKKVIDENVEQIKSHLKDVQNFFAQGIVTKNELLKVEVQLSNIQVMQIDVLNNVRLSMIALNSLIGLPLETYIEIASPAEHQPNEYGDLNSLIRKGIENRSDLKAMDMRVKASETGVSIARSGWFPQIFLIGNYNYARPNQRIFPAQDKFKDTWDVSLSASLDIWNWGATIHQTDQAQAQLAQARDSYAQIKDGITLDITQCYYNFNQSKERISVAHKGVSQAEENYRITNDKFKSGLALNSDLLDAEAAQMQAKWNYIQALVDFNLADARLQKAIGQSR